MKLPPSTRHSNVEPGSLEENMNVGVGSVVVPDGPESIVVSGGVVSTMVGAAGARAGAIRRTDRRTDAAAKGPKWATKPPRFALSGRSNLLSVAFCFGIPPG